MDADDIKQAVNKGRLVYSCKCGWIDTLHASPKSSRSDVGPAYLWNQIVNETGRQSVYPGTKGFQVVYTQDAVWNLWGLKFYPGITKKYLVSPNLPLADKESVAMAIFQEVSYAFEQKQGLAFWSGSSFANGDLVSNLLSFYSIVLPGKDYLKLCEPISAADSIKLLDKYTDTFSTQTRNFLPLYYDCNACAKTGPFPPELQAIVPAKKGNLFDDWLQMYDWKNGIPPMRGPKW